VSLKDISVLSRICSSTFIETYEGRGKSRPFEMAKRYAEEKFSEETLANELQNPLNHFFLFYADHSPIGYAKLSKKNPPEFLRITKAIQLEQIYFQREYKGQGFGKQAFRFLEKFCREKAAKQIWLGVWEENVEAIAFYKSQKFERVGSHPWKFEYDGTAYEDIDEIMLKDLSI
jgi:ribosomal protein S18 acetylase RimI-like enzyme